MDQINPINIAHLRQKYGLKPRKDLGQNFLVDDAALQRIVESADLSPESKVLEIGAGLGHLTRYLAVESGQVTTVEIDKTIIPALQEILLPYDNVRIVQGDILALNPSDLINGEEFVIVANIPYYITSAILRHLLTSPVKPLRMVLTVQYEVARRICAMSGEMSVLA
jgi:16S rRNA (adenine1518-N6/adenine1519-N6)-dimethyltransferase